MNLNKAIQLISKQMITKRNVRLYNQGVSSSLWKTEHGHAHVRCAEF